MIFSKKSGFYRCIACGLLLCSASLCAQETKMPSRVSLRDDGVMLVNDAPFYPIATYRDPGDDLADFSGVLEAGFNTTHSYYFEDQSMIHTGSKVLDESLITTALRYLKAAHEQGLMVFMGLPRVLVHAGDLDAIREFVNALKHEPALLVWYLLDEPSVRKVPPRLMQQVQTTVTQADPHHPTLVVFSSKVGSYQGGFDIAGFDHYPIKGSAQRVDGVTRFIHRRKREFSGVFPFWHVVQAHDLSRPQQGQTHTPSPAQIRSMAFLGIISGARGTAFYWWPSAWCNILDFPEVWNEIKGINSDLEMLSPILTAQTVMDHEITLTLSTGKVLPFLIRSHEDEIWIIAANTSNEKATATLSFPAGRSHSFMGDALNPARKLLIQNQSCELVLEPLEVCALRFAAF